MNKNIKKIRKQLNLCNDLIDIFTDYAFVLDDYFQDEINRKEHLKLWNEYQILNVNLKDAFKRNGFDKS